MSRNQFKITVKDGDHGYNKETGNYETKDFVYKTKDAAEAVGYFLNEVTDDGGVGATQVTLSFSRKEKK